MSIFAYNILVSSISVTLYFVLYYFVPKFFAFEARKISIHSWYSVVFIALFSFFAIMFTTSHNDPWWGNRLQHALSGGFMAYFVYFLAIRDAGLRITYWRTAFFGFLIVMTLGVANEIFEYFVQTYTDMVFSWYIEDTWLDLISNAVGALVAVLISAIITFRHPE